MPGEHRQKPSRCHHCRGLLDIDRDSLVAVLEPDTLGVRGVRLFSAIARWSESECQRQQPQVTAESKCKVPGKALAHICFPVMTMEEFAAQPVPKGILVDCEVVKLLPALDGLSQAAHGLHHPAWRKECLSIGSFQQRESAGATTAPATTSGSPST